MGWLGNAEVGLELRDYAPGLEGVPPHGIYYCGAVWKLGLRTGSAHPPGNRWKPIQRSPSGRAGMDFLVCFPLGSLFVLGFSGRSFYVFLLLFLRCALFFGRPVLLVSKQ